MMWFGFSFKFYFIIFEIFLEICDVSLFVFCRFVIGVGVVGYVRWNSWYIFFVVRNGVGRYLKFWYLYWNF